MSDVEIKFLVARGAHIRNVIAKLRQWFIKNPYPIELRKVTCTFAAGSKKFGGINLILSELEVEGIVELNMVETKFGILQTIMLCEFKNNKRNIS